MGDADKIHVLTIDYRGFGYSTGSPTEEGLITDGITLVQWAMDVAEIPANKIILVGQSLGTAVATAVTEHFVVHHGNEFAGVVLIAGFSDIPTLMLTYAVGYVIPILSPLRPYPKLQQFFSSHIRDTWRTATRLAKLVRHSNRFELVLIHTLNDFDIPWSHCETLFYSAANATSDAGLSIKQIDGVKEHIDLGSQGWINTWTGGTGLHDVRRIKQVILRHGGESITFTKGSDMAHSAKGHNRVCTYSAVSKAVLELFERAV